MTKQNPRVWIVRAGPHGEDEDKALSQGLAIIGFRTFPDLKQFGSVDDLVIYHQTKTDPNAPERRSRNFAQQLWTFRETIQEGDFVALVRVLGGG